MNRRTRNLLLIGTFAVALVSGCAEEEGRNENFDGPWVRHTIDDTGRGADGVRVADVNGDGLPDVTSGWEQSGISRAYLHPGIDAVRDPWPGVTVGATPNVEDAVWADVDGDGNMDVVSCSEGQTQSVFVSFAPSDLDDFLDASKWETEAIPATVGRRWMYAAPMDVDGQAGIDLVVGGKRGDAILAWLESPRSGDPRDLSAWKLHEISDAGWVMSIEVLDMNDDGRLDLLVSDRASSVVHGVRWVKRPNDPVRLTSPWPDHLIGASNRSPAFIAPALDQNSSVTGVVVPSGSERLTLFQRADPAATLWSEHTIPFPSNVGTPKSVAVGDIDQDGTLDVVLASTNLTDQQDGIVWLSGAAQPLEGPPQQFDLSGAQGEKFDRMELLDLDGDGDLDVLTTEEVQQFGVIWYENPLFGSEDD